MISSRYYENAKEFAIVYTQLLKNLGDYFGDAICFSNNHYKHSIIYLHIDFGFGHDFIWDYEIAEFIEFCERDFLASDHVNFDNLFNQAALQCKELGLITD